MSDVLPEAPPKAPSGPAAPREPAPLEPASARIGRLIQQAGRNWRRAIDQQLQPLGLTEATWLPLLYLARVGPVRQVDLADYIGVDRSSVVRVIDALAAQGLVARESDPSDRRANLVHLTPAAAPLVAEARQRATGLRHRLVEGIDPAALEAAEDVLTLILTRLALEEGMK